MLTAVAPSLIAESALANFDATATRPREPAFVREELDILFTLMRSAASSDDDTLIHMVRVGFLAERLATLAGTAPAFAELLRSASPMHDIGKICIPERILKKKAPLTTMEWRVMRQHSAIGAGMLSHSLHPMFRLAGVIALNHHERFDGTGYPSGLIGHDIPYAARLVAVVDVFDALTMDRSYRPRYDDSRALAMMIEESGRGLDPALVDCFLIHSKEMIALRDAINLTRPDFWQALGLDRFVEVATA